MKYLYKLLFISLLSISTFAQQASEIDPKFVKLPRYANLAAITNATTGITTPTQGMMVYNIGTASNWYYNGTTWVNTSSSGSLSLPYSNTASNLNSLFEISNSAAVPQLTPGVTAIKGEFNGVMTGSVFPPLGMGASGIYGVFNGTGSLVSPNSSGVYGKGNNGASGIIGESNSNAMAILGVNTSNGYGIYGSSNSGIGGYFSSNSGYALITGVGNVGIGTATPTSKLHLSTSTGNGITSETTETSANSIGILGRATQINNLPSPAPYYTAVGIKGEILGNSGAGTAIFGESFGGGTGVKGVSVSGYGVAGSSSSIGIWGSSSGGNAGYFTSFNSANSSPLILGLHSGSGNGISVSNNSTTNATAIFTNNTSNALALEISGGLKFGGSGVGTPAAGKVLMANDNLGNATWQNPITLPYSNTATNTELFTIINNSTVNPIASGPYSAIRGEFSGSIGNPFGNPPNHFAAGVIGIYSGTSNDSQGVPNSSGGIYGQGNNRATGVIGISDTGWGGYFSSSSGAALTTGTGNVGIGTYAPSAKLDVAGYTKLGDDATAPKIKMKELATFNTASGASAGAGLTSQAHGLTASKIISVSILVNVTGNLWIPPVYTSDPRLNYNFFIFTNDIFIQNSSTDCTSSGDHICGKPVKVLITYKE